MTAPRVLIADDHTLFRTSLKALLEAHGYEVIGEASTGAEALRLASSAEPDVVLMDLLMPDIDGFEATRRLTVSHPGMQVIVLTGSNDESHPSKALKAGAAGYLCKTLGPERFFEQLELVMSGASVWPPELEMTEQPAGRDPMALSRRELDVLRQMVAGYTTTRQLAPRLGVSENTVKFHVRNILEKLQLTSRAEAVSFAVRNGLVSRRELKSGLQGPR